MFFNKCENPIKDHGNHTQNHNGHQYPGAKIYEGSTGREYRLWDREIYRGSLSRMSGNGAWKQNAKDSAKKADHFQAIS